MAISLDGQVALVTGAGRGIGRSVALDLARHGAKVIVDDTGGDLQGHGTDPSVAEAVVAEIKKNGGEAIASAESVATYEGGYNLVKLAVDTWGRLDIVVSNAGFLRDAAFHNLKEEDWKDVLTTHLFGAYNVLRHAWPVFRQQNYGRVVLTSSSSGFVGNFGQANYASAKAGLIGLANDLKLEGAKYNVNVNVLGPIAGTRMTENLMPPDRLAATSPDFVAPAVTYLCSPDNKDSGFIIEAGGKTFGRAAIVRNEPLRLENPTADEIAANWGRISDISSAEVWWNLGQKYADFRASKG